MLSEAEGMACKSCLLLFALVVMSVCVSAHRSLVENKASRPGSPLRPLRNSVDGKMKVDGSVQQNDGIQSNNVLSSEALPPPNSINGGEKLIFDSTKISTQTGPQPGSLGPIGLIPIIPGGDGSFHFALGPIDFGGSIGWGGFAPGYVVSYSQPQPYVVVSPYASSYAPPYPNPPPLTGYGQPSQGYSSPVTGYGQPLQGYSSPVTGYGQPLQGYSSPIIGYGQPSSVSGYGQPSQGSNPYPSSQGNTPPVTVYGQPSQGNPSPDAPVRGNARGSPQARGSFSNGHN